MGSPFAAPARNAVYCAFVTSVLSMQNPSTCTMTGPRPVGQTLLPPAPLDELLPAPTDADTGSVIFGPPAPPFPDAAAELTSTPPPDPADVGAWVEPLETATAPLDAPETARLVHPPSVHESRES